MGPVAYRNARFAQGGNAFFEGKVKGNPTPRIVWTRKGMEMKESSKHQMIYEEATGRVALQGRQSAIAHSINEFGILSQQICPVGFWTGPLLNLPHFAS